MEILIVLFKSKQVDILPQLFEKIYEAAARLNRFFRASGELMQVLARACGHNHLNQFCLDDLTTWKRDMAYLCGLNYAGVTSL